MKNRDILKHAPLKLKVFVSAFVLFIVIAINYRVSNESSVPLVKHTDEVSEQEATVRPQESGFDPGFNAPTTGQTSANKNSVGMPYQE